MSITATVYSVAAGPLRAAPGSRNEELKLALRLGKDAKSIALRELIDGTAFSQDPSIVCYAFERLCAHFGRQLPIASFSPTDGDMMARIDAALKDAQVPFSVQKLIYGPAPIELPLVADFPTVGSLDEAQVQATAEMIAKNGLKADEAELDQALFDISEWTKVATARRDMLVGFSY